MKKVKFVTYTSEYMLPRAKPPRGAKKQNELLVAKKFAQHLKKNKIADLDLFDNQPVESDPADVYLLDRSTNKKVDVQVRVSDDAPWKTLLNGQIFQRTTKKFEMHHPAIRKAISDKSSKYPFAVKKNTILLLDGWLGVRAEDLDEFISSEQDFLKKSGFKEIWFMGFYENHIRKIF